jgi:hypothetical protein
LNRKSYFDGRLILDHYALKKIELRGNGDLVINPICWITYLDTNNEYRTNQAYFEYTLHQSEWINKYLPVFNFKQVHLIELPIIEGSEIISKHLTSAWNSKSMGKYDETLVYCRKALEEISNKVKKDGFSKQETGDKNPVPDWKEYFNSERIGEIFSTINPKIAYFTAPGAHTGSSINLEDADYAILITYAIINYVFKRKPSTDSD